MEQPENIEIPKDRDLESAMSRLRSKIGRAERKGTTLPDRGGGRDVFADGLEF